jgi:MFS transporter, DHA1 family, multidrug resistance protein
MNTKNGRNLLKGVFLFLRSYLLRILAWQGFGRSLINKITRKFVKGTGKKTEDADTLKSRRIIILLSVSVALIMTGFGIIMPVFARRLEDFGSGVVELGYMAMGFAFAQFALSPILGSLGDRIGRRPIILLALGGYAAVNIAFLFAANTGTLIVLRCLEGGLTAGLLPAAQATVGDIVPANRRAQGVGMVMAGYGFGFILGPFIGGLLYDMWGFSAPFIASSSMGLIALVFAWVMVPETHTSAAQSKIEINSHQPRLKAFSMGYLPKPLTTFAILILVSFVLTFTFAFISPVMVFYVYDDLKFSATQFGLLVGVLGLAMVLGQIFLGGLSDKYGRKPVIILGLIVSSIFYLGMIVFTKFASCFLVSAIGGIGSALATSATSAYILDISDQDHRSQIQGIRGSFMALGEAMGPLLAVFVSSQLTAQSMFLVSAVIGVVVAVTVLIILRGKRQTVTDIKSTQSFEPALEAAGSGHELAAVTRSENE